MKLVDIGEISQRSGLAVSALRYYEELGLIRSVARHGLRRQFEPDTLLQLDLIGLARKAGFSLQEIAGMQDGRGRTQFQREELIAHAGAVAREIEDLSAMRKMLLHMAKCPAPTHLECESFRNLLRETRAKAQD